MGSSRSLLGWLAIPPVLLAFVLAGLAVSTEPKEEFEDRARSESQQDQQDEFDNETRSSESRQNESNSSSSGSSSGGDDEFDVSQGEGDGGRNADGTRQPIIIRTDNGEIVIEFDDDGRPNRAVTGDSVSSSRVFTPDPDGGYVGFRVTEGRLEPVKVDDLNDDDYQLLTGNDTLDIVRPDGTEFRLRIDTDNQFSATRTTPAGQTEDLAVNTESGEPVVVQTRAEFEDVFVGEPGDSPEEAFVVDPNTEPIGIALETGQVVIDLQQDGSLTATPGNGTTASDFDDRSAIRVDENGNFEVIPLDEIGPDDTVLVPQGNGFDLVRPDGSRVEFRPDGENDGVTATEVSVDGERRELEPNPDGTVTLDDGRTVGPIDFAEDGGAFERLLDQTSDLPWPWVFAGIALLTALSVGTAVHLHRNRPRNEFDFGQFAVEGVPEDKMEKFLAAIGNEPDPTRAIRLAFYTVERGMAGLPPRRADETPFEWHGRVAAANPQLAAPLGPICDLFALARFAPNEATVADRDLMIEHLRELNRVAHNYSQRPATAGV